MTVHYKNEIITLPEWCKTWTDEKVMEAAKVVYEEKHNPIKKVVTASVEKDIDIDFLIKELRKEGFSFSQIEEIVAKIDCGHSVDSAIQSI